MSAKPAVIRAEFTDYRPVKTRKTLILSFEIPAEEQGAAFAALGYPVMGSSIWVAIARIQEGAGAPTVPERAAEPAPVEKAKTKRSSRAYLMCLDFDFQNWIGCKDTLAPIDPERPFADADALLKKKLGIKSKSELDTDPEAAARFDALRTDFELRDMVR